MASLLKTDKKLLSNKKSLPLPLMTAWGGGGGEGEEEHRMEEEKGGGKKISTSVQ